MPKLIPFILLCITYNISQAQDIIKNYVKQNTHQVLTIEPDSTDYSDLKSIGDAIGDVRIVMLGEQEHGDATTFLAKSRLIKYLHEKKGFNVLAFESDFYCLNEGWDKLPKTKENIDSFIYKNVYPIWALCHTCTNLFYNYIATTFEKGSPLQISGIDCQMYGSYSTGNFTKEFSSYFGKYANLEKNIALILPLMDSLIVPNFVKTTATSDTLINNLNVVYNYLNKEDTADKFWLQILKSLIAEATHIQARLNKDVKKYYYRDMQMADNLEWLCRYKYLNEKIIIWAHSAHIAKNGGNIFNFFSKENEMMGSYIDRDPFLRDKVYRLGFTSYSGYTKWVNKANFGHTLKLPKKQSLENWVNKKYNYAFVDFKKFRVINPNSGELFYMKGSTYYPHYNYNFNWANIFEGVFFIRDMYGCK
jgi:erythromycin esterase